MEMYQIYNLNIEERAYGPCSLQEAQHMKEVIYFSEEFEIREAIQDEVEFD